MSPRNRITAVGLELEGGWESTPPGPVFQPPSEPPALRPQRPPVPPHPDSPVPPSARRRGDLPVEIIKRDGSVQFGSASGFQTGEVVSPPIADIEEARNWLVNNHPHAVNNTCGFHIHLSLPAIHYSRLMNPSFNDAFLSAMEDFWAAHRNAPGMDLFRARLDGQNRYCQKIFRPEDQLWRNEHYGPHETTPRYSQLNYCFGRHGTMECRLFPCFEKVRHNVAALDAFVTCVNRYLASIKPERPLVFDVKSDPTPSDLVLTS